MKTGGTQVPVPKASNNSKYKEGDVLVCTSSASVGYTVGREYTVYKNSQGWRCLKADDGFEDICSMLVSTFKKKGT